MAREVVEQEYRLIDKVSAGFKSIAGALGGLKGNFTELNQAAELAAKGINLVKAAAAGIGEAVSGAADVETALARVNDITKATTTEQLALREAIKNAANDLGVTAAESSAALVMMAEDGFSAADAIGNLGTVLAFAKANAQSAAEATAGLGTILDAFGAAPETIGALADSLTATARAAGVSTSALQDGLGAAGLAADQANLSVEETVALLGVLATRGIEGGRAGKVLTTALQDLTNPASTAGRALKEVGLEGASTQEILNRLATDSSAATVVLEALGNRPRAALKALLTDGGGAIEKFTGIVKNNSGATKEAADVLKGTFNDALGRLKASFDQLQVAFLTPILSPLTAQLNDFQASLIAFTESAQFEKLTQQVQQFVTLGIQALGDALATVDFTEVVQGLADFASSAVDNFNKIAAVAQVLGSTLATVFDVVKGGAALIVESFAGVASDITSVLGLVSDEAANVSQLFGDMAVSARGLSDEALADLSKRFGLTATAASNAGAAIDGAGTSAKNASIDIKKLAEGLIPEAFKVVAEAAKEAATQLGDMPKPIKLISTELNTLDVSARDAALGLARLSLARLVNEQAALAAAGQINSARFRELTVEIGATEQKIQKLIEANDKAAGTTDKVSDSATRAASSLRDYGSAADGAASAASRVESGNSAVAESFGNINGAASETAVSMGNLTEAFVRQALEAAGAAGTIRGYIDTLNAALEAGQREDEVLTRAIELRQRQVAGLSEEDAIRRRLEQQYGTSSVQLETLVKLELQLADAKKKKNTETQREVELEERKNAAVAGGLGTNRAAAGQPAAAPAVATGGRSAAPEQSVTINIQGLPGDRTGWRQAVADFILPELNRLQRLGA